jgi:hypothetical protein
MSIRASKFIILSFSYISWHVLHSIYELLIEFTLYYSRYYICIILIFSCRSVENIIKYGKKIIVYNTHIPKRFNRRVHIFTR